MANANPDAERSGESSEQGVEWGSLALAGARALTALALAISGARKLVDYAGRTAYFAALGTPAPELLVPVVAVVELFGALTLGTGASARLGAAATVPVMVVAIALVGPVASNLLVLATCLAVLLVGPGTYRVGPDLADSVPLGGRFLD